MRWYTIRTHKVKGIKTPTKLTYMSEYTTRTTYPQTTIPLNQGYYSSRPTGAPRQQQRIGGLLLSTATKARFIGDIWQSSTPKQNSQPRETGTPTQTGPNRDFHISQYRYN